MYTFKSNIDNREYDKFIKNFSMAPITQDRRWANVKENWDNTLVGLYKDGVLVAASLLLVKTFPLNLKMIYAPKGFLIDYTDEKLLKKFTEEIKKYAKSIGAFIVKIDPLIAITEEYYDTLMGSDTKESPKNYSDKKEIKIKNLNKCGYKHGGYRKEVGAYIQPRFNMAISLINENNKKLTEQELLSSFKRNAKRYYGDFHTSRGITFECYHDCSHIDEFYEIIKSTEDRQGISLRDKTYFKRIMESFNKDAYMYIAYCNIDKFIDFLDAEISKTKDEKLKIKYKEQKDDALNVKEKYGNNVAIASTLGIIPPNTKGIKKVEYLYAGTREDIFPYLNANASVHINSFIEMLNNKYDYADLEGVDGDFKDHLSNTKSKYNPIVFEFVGEYNLCVKKFWFLVFTKFNKTLKKIYNFIR